MASPKETKIQIVLLMAKLDSPTRVIRGTRRLNSTRIPERHAVSTIYQKFLETGSVIDLSRLRRPFSITGEMIDDVETMLNEEPMNSVRNVARAANVSKYQAHQIMRDILGYKPYMRCIPPSFYTMKIKISVSKWRNI